MIIRYATAECISWLVMVNLRAEQLPKKNYCLYLIQPHVYNSSFVSYSYIYLLKYILFCSQSIENNWRMGRHNLQRINCRSENSKGVYCLQYDDHKIVSGLRDNTIKIWDRYTLQCVKVLTGHTGSVLCLQYDDKVCKIALKCFNLFTYYLFKTT